MNQGLHAYTSPTLISHAWPWVTTGRPQHNDAGLIKNLHTVVDIRDEINLTEKLGLGSAHHAATDEDRSGELGSDRPLAGLAHWWFITEMEALEVRRAGGYAGRT